LRLLTHQFNGRRKGGYAMTYTTVASIIKYPWASCSGIKKKYGYFKSEKEVFDRIMEELGIVCLDEEKNIYARHPLVYLVEAADDICYQIMDIEDAHKLRILSYDETVDLFMNFLSEDEKREARFDEVFEEVTDTNEQIAYLRAKIIGKLVTECTNIYLENYDGIMAGSFNKSLIGELGGHTADAMNIVAETAYKRVYKHPMVAEVELSGFKILGTLVDEFVKAVLHPGLHYSKMLLPFMPEQYEIGKNMSVYNKIQTVLDFVSGMTDVYALDLYRKIKGTGISTK
jgi:dGTPase